MEEKKKSNMGLIIGVLVFLVIGLGAFIFCDKVVFKDEVKQQENSNQEQNNKNEEDNTVVEEETETENCPEVKECEACPEVKVPVCTGTYYGEKSGSAGNGLSYDYKYTYVLKNDGTFTADFGTSSSAGTFVINGNTISLTGLKDTTGPEDQVTQYETTDLLIAADCSYIMYDDNGFKLYKK